MKKFNLLDTTNTTILADNAAWALPQVAAWFNNWTLHRNSNDKISFKKTLTAILAEPNHPNLTDYNFTLANVKGIWAWLTTGPRGKVIKSPSQTSPEGLRWSCGVPLILSFFKQYRNIPYTDWDWTEPEYRWWLDKDLIEWVTCSTDPEFIAWLNTVPNHQWDLWLELSLTVRRGDSSGKSRKPTTLPNVYSTGDLYFDKLPRLVKLSLCKAHCWHPSHKAKYILYHPNTWDAPAEIAQTSAVLQQTTELTNPWNEI